MAMTVVNVILEGVPPKKPTSPVPFDMAHGRPFNIAQCGA
jgi:hypothetical protein